MIKDEAGPRAVPVEKSSLRSLSQPELAATLAEHRKWLDSGGQGGQPADLSYCNLEGADLCGARLQKAILRKANLTWADLSLADLGEACLIRADLREAYLLGTNLREANLQGANLAGATGLSVPQLAGAQLSGASLPGPAFELEQLKTIRRASRVAFRLLGALLLVSILAWIVVVSASDVELLTNASLPHLGSSLPLQGFFLIAPLFLLGVYVGLHYYLQRLWEALADSPAVFSDGGTLDQKTEPRFLGGLVRARVKWLGKSPPPRSPLETSIARLFLHGVPFATLFLFWGRYLTIQDLHGSIFQVLVLLSAIGLGMYFRRLLKRTFSGTRWQPAQPGDSSAAAFSYGGLVLLLGLGLLLSLLSAGIIQGVPHDTSRAPGLKPFDVRRLAAHVFWLVGYDPYPNVVQASLSARGEDSSGGGETLEQVEGAQLQRSTLRFLEGYRAFLAKADLWRADLRYAFLSQADLREANLHQANLGSATLDRARLSHAKLQEASLQETNLARADLRNADLSYAVLHGAILADAELDYAGLYGADLQAARLSHASLLNADLRNATLAGARLDRADLRGAVLQGTDLSGAHLENADLRNALFLEADQVCSAGNREGVRLDEELRRVVAQQCGPGQAR